MPKFTARDLDYINRNFFAMTELCEGREETPGDVTEVILEGHLPRSAYSEDDGSEWFGADSFSLIDEAGGVENLHDHFVSRLISVGADGGFAEEIWTEHLTGVFFVCLRTSPQS